MSDYVKNKVLRYPIPQEILNKYEKDDLYYVYEELFPSLFIYNKPDCFTITWSYDEENRKGNYYLDYLLESHYGTDAGDWGYSRELTKEEKDKYILEFKKIFEDVNMDKVHKVVYNYYNGVDEPDYYSLKNNPNKILD
jgi:hypothetical protein